MPKNYQLLLKGRVGSWNFNADMVDYILDKHKDAQVNVLIDSLGGDVATALSISSRFLIHGNVHCHYVGMNASAATIASMGAKHVSIDANALFLVHKCLALVLEWDYMNADQLAEHIENLEKMKKDNETIDGCIAGMYAKRCKKTKAELLDLMKDGAWLTPKQALEWGFVDEITNLDEDEKPVLTDAEASVLAEAGIPLPPIQVKKDSFIERLFKAFSPSRSSKPVEAVEDSAPTQSLNEMKNLPKLAALLGAAIVMADGKFSLDEGQLGKIEDALAAHDDEVATLNDTIASKDSSINELNAKIADLVKEPASKTGTVTEESKDDKPFKDADVAKFVDALNSIF